MTPFCKCAGGDMKSVKFWQMAAKQLSWTEKMFFKDAIKTLLQWQILKEEYLELDLIMRILESEIHIVTPEARDTDRRYLQHNDIRVPRSL
jgi:hypothetical protein